VTLSLRIHRLAHARDLPLPEYATAQAAGLDLVAAAEVEIAPMGRAVVPTGLAVEIPDGYEGQVRPRSGLAARHGVTVLNAPGTIDADYRGEVQVILINFGPDRFVVSRGMRVAQLVIAPFVQAALVEADALPTTARGAGGLGSTGLSS
jgi:dUTP pyrophosphatase